MAEHVHQWVKRPFTKLDRSSSKKVCATCGLREWDAALISRERLSRADRDIMEALVRLVDAGVEGQKVLARTISAELPTPATPMFVGRRLGALKRRGLVDSVYPSVEAAGVPLVWWPTDSGREALK